MSDDWGRWGALVLSELKRISTANEEHARELVKIKMTLTELRAQAGFFGAVAGFVCGLIPLAVGLFLDKYLKQ